MSKNNVYQWIDVFKLIFAALIVLMHADMLNGNGFELRIQITVFALAVPFFFIATGFFVGNKLRITDDLVERQVITKRSIKKFLKLYLIFGSWYFLLDIVKLLIKHEDLAKGLFFLFHRCIVYTPGGGMWYVYTAIIGLSILVLLKCKNKLVLLFFILSSITYMFGGFFFMDKYSNILMRRLYSSLFISDLNIIFFSVYLFGGILLGIYFNVIKNKINLMHSKLFLISIITLYIIYGLFLHNMDNNLSVFFFLTLKLISCFSIFILCLNMKAFCADTTIIRQYSSSMYFIHWNFINLLLILRKYIYINRFVGALLCLLLSIILSTFVIKLKKGKYYRLLFE